MKLSKRQLLRIIREEAEAAVEEEAEASEDSAEDSAEESETTTEAALRRRVRAALIKESRGAGLFGGIGFEGLGQTNQRNAAKAYHGTYSNSRNQRVVSAPTRRNRLVKEEAAGNPKDVLYKTVLPALEDAGFRGIEAFKMLRKVVQAMEADLQAMLGPR